MIADTEVGSWSKQQRMIAPLAKFIDWYFLCLDSKSGGGGRDDPPLPSGLWRTKVLIRPGQPGRWGENVKQVTRETKGFLRGL